MDLVSGLFDQVIQVLLVMAHVVALVAPFNHVLDLQTRKGFDDALNGAGQDGKTVLVGQKQAANRLKEPLVETEHSLVSVVSETMVLWEALILFTSLALFISGNFIFLILMKYYESIPFINRNTVTYLSMYLICILLTIIIVAVII